MFKEKNEVAWSPVPLDSLLDVAGITAHWARRGLVIHATPALTPFPDLTQPDVAYPLFPQPELDPALIARVEGVYLKNLDMSELLEKVRAAAVNHTEEILRADPKADVPYVVLDLPCTFFMLRSLRCGEGGEGGEGGARGVWVVPGAV